MVPLVGGSPDVGLSTGDIAKHLMNLLIAGNVLGTLLYLLLESLALK